MLLARQQRRALEERAAGAVRTEELELVAPHAAGSPASEAHAEVADGVSGAIAVRIET